MKRLIKSSFVVSFLLACVIGSSSLTLGQQRDWDPQHTFVFIVGTLEWKDSETFPSFPKANRRDAQLADFFRREGVPSSQLVFLRDQQATTRRVRNEFSKLLSQTRAGDFLFVYFTGHGYKSDDERTTFFATYDAGVDADGWSTRSIVQDINWSFRGSRVLLTADCCYSGALARDARGLKSGISYACLASATSDKESTENWTFTEMLLASLRGTSYTDLDGDREISLGELVENERRDMRFAEEQEATFASRGIPNEMVIALAGEATDPAVGRRVMVRSEGDWYKGRIIDVRGSRYRVRYFGYDDSFDEWVTQRQIRSNGRGGESFGAAEKWLLGRQPPPVWANTWGQ